MQRGRTVWQKPLKIEWLVFVLLLLGDDVTDTAAEEGVVAADKPRPIHDITTFRSELGLYPLPVPNIWQSLYWILLFIYNKLIIKFCSKYCYMFRCVNALLWLAFKVWITQKKTWGKPLAEWQLGEETGLWS